ncbi:MAG: quinolinate synthase NadA [Ruminococcaceae bacterium]|nr:quinolinate synthase NadA [Oscillospiraceae bacterium]
MDNITREIKVLKEEKGAIILAHYYAPEDVQKLADFVGDSFYLAKVAKNTDAKVVVFCGVSFMGESAKILNPEKTVLMPDINADCAMAHMADVKKIKKMREEYDDLAVVCYINSTAELKCHSDVCVTSSNAIKIVRSLKNKNIYFIPDNNLGRFVANRVPEKNVILNDGCCPIHVGISKEALLKEKEKHPSALVLSHPECTEDVLSLSDYIGSTAEIIDYAKESDKKEFIICTECGVKYELEKDNPEKKFYFLSSCATCRDMKLNTPEKILHVLKTGENEITVDKEVAKSALVCLDRMLEMGK